MGLKYFTITLVLTVLLFSCDNKKDDELRNRERELELREQKVLSFEADYNILVKLRDSLQAAKTSDTTAILKTWPANLQRIWNSKMICTASDCSNYVIGDQRNEVWRFFSDSTGSYMNVINNDKLVRVFKGSFVENKITLDYVSDSTSVKRQQIRIVMDDIKTNLIKGTQTITGDKNCSAKFSVELTPSTNK